MAEAWTVPALREQLPGAMEGEITLSGEGETLIATFPDAGGLNVVMTVSGEQILASTLLWPRDEQDEPHAFEEHALRIHKLLPLSTFGITTLGGRDWYELFGALSARSTLDDVVRELRFLATNAVDMAEARGDAGAGQE